MVSLKHDASPAHNDDDSQLYDSGEGGHPPELYHWDRKAEPFEGLGAIDEAAVEQYRRDGFIAVDQVFDPEEVKAALAGWEDLALRKNPEYKGVHYERFARGKLDQMSDQEKMDAVRKLSWFVDFDERLHHMAYKKELIAVITRLLGGKAPAMFQDMALSKPPRHGREKPWHQDHAYFNYPVDTPIVGCWIALDPVDVDNGCMQVLAGGHHEPIIHFKRRDWQICDKDMLGKTSVAVPLQPGGALFFDGKIPHGTPDNHSERRRRALQFHYLPAEADKCSSEERLAVWGSEGKDVEC
ncbi:MAG: phytanoyl-CoA dioxygenase family protein [Opitutales bacterium]